jgi:hypothetical protein
MSVTLHWSGLDDFKVNLAALPDTLGAEADPIVDAAANAAAAEIRAGYPGTAASLAGHVFVSRLDKGKTTSARLVKNTSPLAFIFENGTQVRHYVSVHGKPHLTGRMPPLHVFVPPIIKHRRAMYVELKALLERNGLIVIGDA